MQYLIVNMSSTVLMRDIVSKFIRIAVRMLQSALYSLSDLRKKCSEISRRWWLSVLPSGECIWNSLLWIIASIITETVNRQTACYWIIRQGIGLQR